MRYDILADKVMYFRDALIDPKDWLNSIEIANTPYIHDWNSWEKYTNRNDGGYQKQYGHIKTIYGGHILKYRLDQFPDDAYNQVKSLADVVDNCFNIYKARYDISMDRETNKDNYILSKYLTKNDPHGNADLQDHLDIDGDWEEYSIIIYINDDYMGGELELPSFDLKIKPEAGSVVIFPSGKPYNHIAHKAYNGQKYFISHFAKTGAGAGYRPDNTLDNYTKDTLPREMLQ
jgi:hypothetical protein